VSFRTRRLLILVSAVGLLLLVARSCVADVVVRFQSPHLTRMPAATLDDDLSRSADAAINEANVASGDDLVRFSLGVTGAHLHFGLEHKTSLRFGVQEREGNCIEYAHLFATVFNRAAERKKVAARAYVVHSEARVLGRRLPGRGLGDHDWVIVVPTAGGQRRFVDPTFYDFGLDWDVSRSVSGDVRVP
jgi:hypothetical protein